MNSSKTYDVILSRYFKKQLKKLVKRDPSLKEEFEYALFCFEKKFHTSLGKNIYKVRLKGLNKGKSGGYRTCICVLDVEDILIPICIYPKSEKEQISDRELDRHVKKVKLELGILW